MVRVEADFCATHFKVRENLLISALVGSAAGSESPNFTSQLGFTWEF